MIIEVRSGFDAGWIEQVMQIHNKTAMKRGDAGQVRDAFAASFDVVIDPEFQKRGSAAAPAVF